MPASPQITDTASASSSLAADVPGSAKLSVKFALSFVLVGIFISSLGFGGVLYYLVRTGRLITRKIPASAAPAAMAGTHSIVLDPLLVNLSGDGGSSYLRLSLVLQVVNPSTKESATKDGISNDESMAAIRDTVLTVLGLQTADDLLAPDGKERLKLELKKSLAEHNGNLKIAELFFTDFLVQR